MGRRVRGLKAKVGELEGGRRGFNRPGLAICILNRTMGTREIG